MSHCPRTPLILWHHYRSRGFQEPGRKDKCIMMTSRHETAFHITGPSRGGPRVTDGFPSQRASAANNGILIYSVVTLNSCGTNSRVTSNLGPCDITLMRQDGTNDKVIHYSVTGSILIDLILPEYSGYSTRKFKTFLRFIDRILIIPYALLWYQQCVVH